MATATYVPLATTTLGSATNTITFSSIPSGYTDLRLVFRGSATAAGVSLKFNSNSSGYVGKGLMANGSSTASSAVTNGANIYLDWWSSLSSTVALRILDVFQYTNTGVYKQCLSTEATDNNGSGSVVVTTQQWTNTSAITSMTLTSNGNFNVGTSVTLWGI